MEEQEKELLEILKNFDKTKLFRKQTYIELLFHDKWHQAFITEENNNQKCDIYIPNYGSFEVSNNMLNFFGENDYTDDIKYRNSPINNELSNLESSELIQNLNKELTNFNITLNSKENTFTISLNKSKSNDSTGLSLNIRNNLNINDNKNVIPDKKGNLIDVTGYLLYQFLEGYILDCLSIFTDLLERKNYDNNHINLYSSILDIAIYMGRIVKENISKYKGAYYNRKLMIVSPICAILISFDSLILNLTPKFEYNYKSSDLEQKINEIVNLVYEIIIASKTRKLIPLHSLIIFVKLLCSRTVKDRIDNYNHKEIYETLNEHMKNLDKNELIYIKKDSYMFQTCKELVNNLFNNSMENYIHETYYSYLLSCLKCNNLEKKMTALNEISEIISKFDEKRKIDSTFRDFIEKNNILDIFFEDSIHDEVIKRSFNIFKYLAKFNCLNDNIIEKIIQRQTNNDLMKKLLFEIISELPKEKKNILFNRLSQGIKFDDEKTNNIEYISKLTESCFNSSEINTKEHTNKEDEKKDNNYYGLNMIFDYIIKDFNDKKRYDENNVDTAIDSFEHIINVVLNDGIFKIDDVVIFLEKLFENIKNNNKNNSIIQSIKLIHILFSILGKKKYRNNFIKHFKILDEKYDIINLIINDLKRYIEKLPKDNSNGIGRNNIYEGIYPHYINVETRLDLIFYLFKSRNNYGLILEGKKHLENIYELFKSKQFNEERKKFYEIITKSINNKEIDNTLLMEFYENILKNKEEFDLKEINDNESINLVIQILRHINYNKESIFYDGKKIRIAEGASIEGIDMLFDLLTQNSKDIVQEKVSQLLCDICLSHKNYNSVKISEYWRTYFDKINLYLDNIINSNDKIALNGIIKLIYNIYTKSCDCYGKVPSRSDFKGTPESKFYHLYHFAKINSKQQVKLKCGKDEKLINMRYKLGCHFSIPVNNVAFIDINKKIYTLNDDFEIFTKIFSDRNYFCEKGFEYVKVKEIQFGLLKIKDNPKDLIEKNDKIYDILINNLKVYINFDNNNDNEISDKKKIWNFISKLPKKYYFEKKIKKFGEKEKVNENEMLDVFNNHEIYLLTYSLQCIFNVLFNDDNAEDNETEENNNEENNTEEINKEEFLNNFIEIHHGDKIIIDIFLDMKIDQYNLKSIQIDCLTILIKVLNELEKYKENKMEEEKTINILNDENLYNKVLKKCTDIISYLLKYDNNILQDDSNSSEDSFDEKIENEPKIVILVENIFSFIDEISKKKKSYMNYIFNDKKLFIEIFINDFIKCKNDSLKKTIEQYLSENYAKNNENIKKYLDVILTVDIFDYLVKNDQSGKYFLIISQIMKNIFSKIEETKNNESQLLLDQKHIEQCKIIIDHTLNYIQNECNKDDEAEKKEKEQIEDNQYKKQFKNKEKLKEGMILFLSNLLNLNSNELITYIINKVDIFDFFLNKCILRKCVNRPLEAKKPFCLNNQSKGAIYKLLQNIFQNINIDNGKENNLYHKMIEYLDNMNKIGFWKTYHIKNWEIESRDSIKVKYVGLKNMTSTCYLNTIIQQLFMIPMFRETILKIENPYKDNVLYELQLLFSALKIFEFSYYSPKSFVLANKLNFYEQMDADEFYGSLIDKIENDIKKIYSKKMEEEASKMEEEEEKNNEKKENFTYKDMFNYFFGIKVLDELQFVDCGHKRYNEFCYNNIQLEIRDFTNIYESLNNYFRTEIMDGDNKINCEQCNTKRTCHKHLLLKTLPNILVISLKRFEFDYDTMLKYKLNKYFEFPLVLNLKNYLIENHIEKNTEYDLTGITIHFGISEYGHYFDIIKGPDKWYKFNDMNVSEFREEDIAKEAFGEKETSSDEDSEKEKESGKNCAYILIYTKKENSINKINNPYLAYPPYSQYSNVKKDIIDIINLKLYKTYLINNLFCSSYHNFVLGLLKMDIAKIIDIKIEKMHPEFTAIMRNEGYIKNYEEKKESDVIVHNNYKVFKFGLRFYFNVIIRLLRKTHDKDISNNFDIFKEIIKIYIQSDINKAKYILEEFSNTKVIDEYLMYCPNCNSSKDCIDIIYNAFVLLYEENDIEDDNSIIYKFLNTWITYISGRIRTVNLENVNSLFYQIINLNVKVFLRYLEKKNLDRWVQLFYRRKKQEELSEIESIFNETNLPTLHSDHSILIEKINISDDDKNNDNDKSYERPHSEENDMYDRQFYKNMNDLKNNSDLVEELNKCLNKNNS